MAGADRFEDQRLREESLKAFVKALHTDRMVAITGAMSTRPLGYPSWDEFSQAYAMIARDLAGEIFDARKNQPQLLTQPSGRLLKSIKRRAKRLLADSDKNIDRRVSMWALHDSFRRLDQEMTQVRAGLVIDNVYQKPALERFEASVAAMFKSRILPAGQHAAEASIRPLIESLGIKRAATLNYDLELEAAFMLRADERDLLKRAHKEISKSKAGSPRKVRPGARFAEYAKQQRLGASLSPALSVDFFIGGPLEGKPIVRGDRNRLSRTLGNGVHVDSDIVDRERPDRLFEFAVGSAETDRHILHLHGRADVPKSLVANIRQYDRLYRLDDLYREPFDHSLRVLFGGNPILFVGIGMSEAELNSTLTYFVSNVPIRRPAPTFVLWNTVRLPDDERRDYMRDRRLDFYSRLGVHMIFDEDIVQPGDQWLGDLMREAQAARSKSPDKLPAIEMKALAETLNNIPRLVTRVDKRIERQDRWRSVLARLQLQDVRSPESGPYRMWGSPGLKQLAKTTVSSMTSSARFNLAALQTALPEATAKSLLFAWSEVGFGRGELSECLLQMPEGEIVIGSGRLTSTQRNNRLLVNAGFSYDSDAMLNGIALFLKMRSADQAISLDRRESHFANGDLFKTRENTLVIINGADRFFSTDGTPLSAELDHLLRCAQRYPGRVQFLLLGTERLRHYCDAIGIQLQQLTPLAKAPTTRPHSQSFSIHIDGKASLGGQLSNLATTGKSLQSSYLEDVAARFHSRAIKVAEAQAADRKTGKSASKRKAAPRGVDLARLDISDAAAAHMGRAMSIDRGALNKAFYEAFLSPVLLKALRLNCPASFEVLRTLCFIGSPMEAMVLLHAPKVRAILAENSEADHPGTDLRTEDEVREELRSVISALEGLGLLIRLDAHQPRASSVADDPNDGTGEEGDILWERFGLHRSLATFLREKYGAPFTDAKLATTFNMSLFMSEPSDNHTSEEDFHDELGSLVDSLIGAWHDVRGPFNGPMFTHFGDERLKLYGDELQQLYIHPKDRRRSWKTLNRRSSREAAACLRAALSVVRGYYSTGALLKHDHVDEPATADRDGALTEHALRLDRLVTGFGDTATARKIMRKLLTDSGTPPEVVAEHLGPDPFYADDLVWLHNERGVVALVQGHLFEARDAFSAADSVNRNHVERNYHGHNWRRIAINRVATQIERGLLKPAEKLLDQIEETINSAPWSGVGEAPQRRIDAIRSMFTLAGLEAPKRGDQGHTREEVLIVAMTTSYRGLIAHMRGRYRDAKELYDSGIHILRRLGEHRALAHFQRHVASLQSFSGQKQQAEREVDYAINAAEAAKQMDILHRARIVRADLRRNVSTDQNVRRQALQDVKNALKYAAVSDCYRVRIEACASLARHMRHGGDYDTALRYATDALTIASRYGHSLQKSSLRIEIGQILMARGDPISGKALLEQAVRIATSKGYQHALERVRRARNAVAVTAYMPNRTDIPILSANG